MARKGALGPVGALAVIAGVVAAAGAIGRRTSPTDDHPAIRDWYRKLDKPAFTPPPIVFGLAWPLIETSLAWGAYRLLRRPSAPERNTALAVLLAEQAGLAAWNELYFGRRRLGAGTVAAAGLAVAAGGYVAIAERADPRAAASAVPLAAWLGFATVLAGSVRRRNAGKRAAADTQA